MQFTQVSEYNGEQSKKQKIKPYIFGKRHYALKKLGIVIFFLLLYLEKEVEKDIFQF